MDLTNSDKPADNNVFTGRQPVSTGPHHHWQHQQQQQQQLLMQDDRGSQTVFTNYPA